MITVFNATPVPLAHDDWGRLGESVAEGLIFSLFTGFAHYLQFNFDETSFLWSESELKFVGWELKKYHEHDCSFLRFLRIVLHFGSAAGMNGNVIFLSKGNLVHSRIRCTNLATRYIFPEGCCLITKKGSYMYDNNWSKVVKVVVTGIRKMKVRNFACVFPIFMCLYVCNFSLRAV